MRIGTKSWNFHQGNSVKCIHHGKHKQWRYIEKAKGLKCCKCESEYKKQRKKQDYNKVKNIEWKSKIKKYYGLSEHEYYEIYKKQEGKCRICFKELKERGKCTHIDHCHKSNNVRGILCRECNAVLGFAKDNTRILKNAIAYLKC